ncbi:MAG TPA: head maturation protease, ClpP-related [Chthoniobacterales bacterium]
MKCWYSIRNAANSTEAEISIYDEIGGWGVSAKQFLADLKAIGNKPILLRINSPGGSIIEGNAIFNALKRHKAGVTVQIDGIAASMATYIAMSGKTVKMAENGLWMIHNPSGLVGGDSRDLRKMADVMDKMRASIVAAYSQKTGKDEEEIGAAMDEETWFTSAEAQEYGFIDEITDPVKAAATFDLSSFRNAPPVMKSSTELATALARIADLEAKLTAPTPTTPDFEAWAKFVSAGPAERTTLVARHGAEALMNAAAARETSAAQKAAEQLAARGIRPVQKDPQDVENLNADEELWTRYQSADPITRSKMLADQGPQLERAARAYDQRTLNNR